MYIFIGMVFENMTANKDLLRMLPYKGYKWGEDIFQAFIGFANKIRLPLVKINFVTIDGAPAVVDNSRLMSLLLSANRMAFFQPLFITAASSINMLYVGKY